MGHLSVDLFPEAPLQISCKISSIKSRKATCDENFASNYSLPSVKMVDPQSFLAYREEALVKITPKGRTTIVNMHDPIECTSFVHATSSRRHSCFALAHIRDDGSGSALNLLRFHKDKKLGGRLKDGTMLPTGFFRKAPGPRDRQRLKQKFGPFLKDFGSINRVLTNLLRGRGLKPGEDVIVMVVNDGEVDLFLNFACSMDTYNLRDLMKNVLVFAGSKELVPLIEMTGAMALSHDSFGHVSRGASYGYLDLIFVDMMWYKSFSVYLLLRQRYNVLFQDVDLVWFRDPFPYFHDYVRRADALHAKSGTHTGGNNSSSASSRSHMGTSPHPEAFFSDDGQRTLRYSPFYANSGFYYLLASARTEHFAWSVVTAFDVLQATGSHQNVFTLRLLEGLDLTRIHPKLLSLTDFATGVMFHHNKTFMAGIRAGTERPYNFHMCWTANKGDKLKNFKNVSMWYLSEKAQIRALRPPAGALYRWALQQRSRGRITWASLNKEWVTLKKSVCAIMPDAPFR